MLTPDFYEYSWTPLASAVVDGDFVAVGWADGTELRCYSAWLRENLVGEGAVDPATREGTADPAHLSADRSMDATVSDDGSLSVMWRADGRMASFHPGWLRHVADQNHLASSWLPEPVSWTADELSEPPTHDGRLVAGQGAESDEALRMWVNDLLRFGIARLRDLPAEPEAGPNLARRIGAIRDTNFGPSWDVRADFPMNGDSTNNSTANTNLRLVPHTDLPTRETPPGFQFLHCLVNETEGGHSTMADGAAVVEHLRQNHPDDYEALTTLRWVFFNRGRGIDHRWSGPVIDLGVVGTPLTLRAFHPLRAFPDMADEDVPRAYDALSCFATLASDERFQMRYPFRAGDLVAFDNRRILHGRDAFSEGGRRHLRGLYIDHDEIRSFARVANRHHAERTSTATTESTASTA